MALKQTIKFTIVYCKQTKIPTRSGDFCLHYNIDIMRVVPLGEPHSQLDFDCRNLDR